MSKSIEAKIIENFIANNMSIKELSLLNGISFSDCSDIIKKYRPVNGKEIILPSISTSEKMQIIQNFWDTKDLKEIADILSCDVATVQRWAFKARLPKKKKVFRNGINRLYESRSIILNTQTGIYYFSKPEAGDSINRNDEYIRWNLFKSKKNKTPFIYCGKF